MKNLRAPFSLRCGAALIDYTLVVGIIAFATLIARFFGGARATGEAFLMMGVVAGALLAVLSLFVLPAFRGQTLGKWATGLRIEQRDGEPVNFVRAFVRHTIGYAISLLTLGLGFLIAIFDPEGRALHDRIAGTIVVRERPEAGVRMR